MKKVGAETVFYLALSFALALVKCKEEGQGALKVDELSVNLVAGSFVQNYQKTSIGIRFTSTPDTLLIEDLKGNILLRAGESVVGGNLRLFELGSDQFIQQKQEVSGEVVKIDWAVPKSHPIETAESPSKQEEQLSLSIDRVSKIGRNIHQDLLDKSVDNLLLEKEVQLLKQAAEALGAEGVIGSDYPSILPFYLSILQLEKYKQRKTENRNSTIEDDSGSQILRKRSRRGVCLNTCPPCPDDDCYGLCGLACNCWRFLCGDCCRHLGCQEHDDCCRDRFVQTSCLFPFFFRCERPYSC